jgi:hypothetical protein
MRIIPFMSAKPKSCERLPITRGIKLVCDAHILFLTDGHAILPPSPNTDEADIINRRRLLMHTASLIQNQVADDRSQ